jgi:DNA-binding LytR/AlgR family response regulator
MTRRGRIADAVFVARERISEAIEESLLELTAMQLDADLEAAELVHRMRQRTDALQATVESHARECAELARRIEDAGKPPASHTTRRESAG